MQTQICFYKNTISHFAHYFFYIVKNSQWYSKYRRSLASSIYNNFPREWSREARRRESRCVVPVRSPPQKTNPGIIVSSTMGHDAESPKTPCRPCDSTRLTRTDGIKSSEGREGRRGKLKFSIVSTASRSILRIRRN